MNYSRNVKFSFLAILLFLTLTLLGVAVRWQQEGRDANVVAAGAPSVSPSIEQADVKTPSTQDVTVTDSAVAPVAATDAPPAAAADTPVQSSAGARAGRDTKASSNRSSNNAAGATDSATTAAPAKNALATVGSGLTDEAVAKKRGITVDQVHRLQTERGMKNAEIAAVPYDLLHRSLFRLDHPKAQMLEEMFRQRAAQMKDENGAIPDNAVVRAYEQKAQMQVDPRVWQGDVKTGDDRADGSRDTSVAGIDSTHWTSLGPGNIGGRIRAIVINPNTPSTMYIGSVGGGIWKTTDGGATWTPLSDFIANLAVTSLVMDPSNSNVIYAATGEGFGNADSIRGAGIFKTTDAGATWTQLSSTANSNFFFVNRLAIDLNNSQVLLAATAFSNSGQSGFSGTIGVWRSTNGGASWSRTYTGTNSSASSAVDVKFHPTNSNIAIAGAKNGAFYSSNGGQSWTAAGGIPTAGRVELTFAKADPSIVYASVDDGKGRIFKSTDGGATYTRQGTVDYCFLSGVCSRNSQGWYDNVIWAGDPSNANHIIVGGIDLYRSLDGGVTLVKISRWESAPASAHADHHAIVSHPQYDGVNNKTVFFGNDGGIYKANDVVTVSLVTGWTELNNNLAITQFYGAAGNATTGRIIGGTQDNGTIRYRPGVANPTDSWNAPFGGDGGYVAYDPTDTSGNYFYGEYVFLNIHRSATADGSSSYIYNGISEATSGSANFIAPFILDPNNPNRLLGGARSLWLSANAKATAPTWTAIKPPYQIGTDQNGNPVYTNISAIAVKPGDSNVIWVGHNNGVVFYTTDGGANWTQVTGVPARYIHRIAIDGSGNNRVYVTTGGFTPGNVQMTTNNGASWTSISGNLPQAPVRSITISPSDPNVLFVGTEVGIFASIDAGANWSTTNDGPSNVSVEELFWMGTKLVAATHGRGLFSITPTGTAASVVQFASAAQSITEHNGTIPVQVTRTGATGAATVEYITNDDQRLFNCNPQTAGVPGGAIAGVATARCDYSSTVGTLSFAAGETSKTINIPLSDDVHVEGAETFSITLRNPVGATLGANTTDTITIQDTPNETNQVANPSGNNTFFVRQHYLDFLGRNPTDAEVQTWVGVTGADCPLTAPDACYDRIWISGKGFFESQEFQQKGYFVYRFYKSLGSSGSTNRLPTYNEFVPDMVNMADTSETQKNTFALQFTQRADFQAIYGALSNNQFVDTLIQRTGIATLNAVQMKADLNSGAKDRWALLREAVESPEMNSREFNNAWVVMQYFGYLRRDGAPSEYNAWLSVINPDPTQWRTMINGFMNSTEYKQRFGDPLR